MKFTIICHLAAFLFINSPRQKGGQITNNCEFHEWDMAESKLAGSL